MPVRTIYCTIKCRKIIHEPGYTTLAIDWKLNTGNKQKLELKFREGETSPNLPLGKEILLIEDMDE